MNKVKLPILSKEEFNLLSNALWFYTSRNDKPIDHTLNRINMLRVKLGCLDNWNMKKHMKEVGIMKELNKGFWRRILPI